MQKNIEGILKDLVHIDNMASDINERRHQELADIEQKYMDEIEKLKKQLDAEKAATREHLERAALEAEDEAKGIQQNNKALLKALEAKYDQVKEEILNQAINKLFGMGMD